MHRKITLSVAVLFALALSAQVVRAGEQDFTLVNKTGIELHKIFVSPHDANEWGEDVMGKDTLADGESVEIKFNRSEPAEDWDLKIMDKDGNAVSWGNLRLTKITKIVLHLEDGKATATIE